MGKCIPQRISYISSNHSNLHNQNKFKRREKSIDELCASLKSKLDEIHTDIQRSSEDQQETRIISSKVSKGLASNKRRTKNRQLKKSNSRLSNNCTSHSPIPRNGRIDGQQCRKNKSSSRSNSNIFV